MGGGVVAEAPRVPVVTPSRAIALCPSVLSFWGSDFLARKEPSIMWSGLAKREWSHAPIACERVSARVCAQVQRACAYVAFPTNPVECQGQ